MTQKHESLGGVRVEIDLHLTTYKDVNGVRWFSVKDDDGNRYIPDSTVMSALVQAMENRTHAPLAATANFLDPFKLNKVL